VKLFSKTVKLFAAASLTATLFAGQSAATTREYTIAFDPATTNCGFFVRQGICATSVALPTPVSALAGDVFRIRVTTPTGAPIFVPGSPTSNGIYVSAFDANATLGPGGPGPIQASSRLLPIGLSTTAGVPPYIDTALSRSFDYLATSGYTPAYGTPNNGFSVIGMDGFLTVVTPGAAPTIGVAAGYFWTTAEIPEVLELPGGSEDAPVILPEGLVSQVSGTVGDPAGPTEQFYNFNWLGGFFQTRAFLEGADLGSEFTFMVRSLDGSYKSTVLLNAANGFSTLFGDNLASGRYVIGLKAGAVPDPVFTFDFLTPVGRGAVPEPSTWAMLIMGFGAVGGWMRRRRPAHA
jgi:hypothetical protein